MFWTLWAFWPKAVLTSGWDPSRTAPSVRIALITRRSLPPSYKLKGFEFEYSGLQTKPRSIMYLHRTVR